MSIQFAGSKSVDDRRRRRLAVAGDGTAAASVAVEGGPSGGRVESELVASAAAAPWVPVYEWRIWTYGAIIGLVLIASAFSLARPTAFRPELAPLTSCLLQGSRPVLAVLIQTTFWFLSAQLAVLIAWYRSQCKLDFGGRYRVWPWAAAVFFIAAFCSATNAHALVGQIISQSEMLIWRSEVVSWLLPACVAALPLTLLVDRDVRRSRSSLCTLRVAWLLGLGSACLELFAAQLGVFEWYQPARMVAPLFGGAALFLGLWLHARVVAYVCPDPPECNEPGVALQLLAGWHWSATVLIGLIGVVLKRFSGRTAAVSDESDAKPKRRSRKAADGEEAATPKRKRKTTVKRAPKPRTRVKVADEEEEEELETEEESYTEDVDETSDAYESEATETQESEWDEEPEIETPPPSVRHNKPSGVQTTTDWSSSRNSAAKSWQEAADEDDSGSDGDDEEGDEASLRVDGGMSADQMRGLSKRQKRELRRQLREQQRNQRR